MTRLLPKPAWILAGAGALLATLTGLWISLDTGIAPPTDSAHHLLTSQIFARALNTGGLGGMWETMRHFYVGWPPASYLLLYGPLGWLLGDQSQMMRCFSLALLPLLLWGTYRLSRLLGAGRALATLAAVIGIFSFGVSGQLRQVSIDLPATVAVLLTLVALARPDALISPRRAALLGAAVGLCLFTRVQSLFFLVGPLLVQTIFTLVEARSWRRRGERVLAWVLAGVVAVLACSPWWFGRLRSLWKISTDHLDPGRIAPRGDPEFWSGLWYYLGALGKLNGWPVLLAVACTLPLLLRGRRALRSPAVRILLTCIIGGLLGCAAGVHREPRYLLPAVPAMAALAAVGLAALSRRRLRELAGAGLLLAVVAPTLTLAAFPLRHRHPLVNAGLLEWAYARDPVRVRAELAGLQAARVLQQVNGGDRTGANTYLLLQQHPKDQFMARLAIFLAPHMPDLLFSPLVNTGLINSPMHLSERGQRKLFVLAEGDYLLKQHFVWEIKRRTLGNTHPVRLYSVHRGSSLHGTIKTKDLPRRADTR